MCVSGSCYTSDCLDAYATYNLLPLTSKMSLRKKGCICLDELCQTSEDLATQELQKMWRAFLTAGGVKDAANRLHLICPENASRLPANMGLTTLLLASPKTMKRVQLLRHGMPGYIVPASMGAAEVCNPAQILIGIQAGCRMDLVP